MYYKDINSIPNEAWNDSDDEQVEPTICDGIDFHNWASVDNSAWGRRDRRPPDPDTRDREVQRLLVPFLMFVRFLEKGWE